ncbi:hypothetical protein OROMI_000965 [Orobanche minor]
MEVGKEASKKVVDEEENMIDLDKELPSVAPEIVGEKRFKNNDIVVPDMTEAPYPYRLRKEKKEERTSEIYEILKQVKISIPLLDALKQIPSYAKYLKDMCTVKRRMNVKKAAFMIENIDTWMKFWKLRLQC